MLTAGDTSMVRWAKLVILTLTGRSMSVLSIWIRGVQYVQGVQIVQRWNVNDLPGMLLWLKFLPLFST